MFGIGMPMAPEMGEAIDASLDELEAGDAAVGRRRRLLQLRRAAVRRRRDPARRDCERLAEVKRRWDPDGMIRANHAVAATAA